MTLGHCRHCGGPTNLLQDERDELIRRRLAGESVTALAREFKVARRTVYNVTDAAMHPEEPGQGQLWPQAEPAGPED